MPVLADGAMVGDESAREAESQERSVVDSEPFKELNLAWRSYLQGLQGQVQGGSGFLLNQVLEQKIRIMSVKLMRTSAGVLLLLLIYRTGRCAVQRQQLRESLYIYRC